MNLMSKIALALATTAAAAGVAHAAPTATYAMKAGAGDLYEITSSKLVMNSTNPKLKAFATMMVTDHTKSTAMVKDALAKSNFKPKPPMLTAKQSADVAALRAASGANRDALYITQQMAANQEALALHKDEAATGATAALKTTAGNIVPVVEHHIQELASM